MDEPNKTGDNMNILLIGNICSGKTTASKILEKDLKMKHLCIDDMRKIHCDGTQSGENKAWSEIFKMLEKEDNLIFEFSGTGRNVRTVQRYLPKGTLVYLLEADSIVCLDRHKKRGETGIPFIYNIAVEDSIRWMSAQLFNLTGWDRSRYTIHKIKVDKLTPKQVVQKILDLMKK